MTIVENTQTIIDKIGVDKIKYVPANNEGEAVYQFTFFRNNLKYTEWVCVESGDILMELLKINKDAVHR
jgi:hypothetical protein